jgi:hypothetical protein
MLVEDLKVIGAQLIDDDRDDKARRISGAQGRSIESEGRRKQTRSGYEGDESTHGNDPTWIVVSCWWLVVARLKKL